MAGGKGGSTTSTVTIPEYIEAAAQRNLNKAERISQIGYTPYYGPDVAAFTPMQQAGFQNIADTAGAFGMAAPTTQQDIMGGMGPATTYAGGVQGYSSAPIYEQALQTFGEQRPGQKAYIDSFFIDPYSGGGAANNFVPIDYTQYNTAAQDARTREAADRDAMLAAEEMRMQGSALSAPQYNTYVTSIQEAINDTSYDPRIDVLTPEQQIMIQNNPQAQLAQEDLAMGITGDANNTIVDTAKGLLNIEPSFDSPSSAGSYGGSLVTGGLSGDLTGIPGVGNIADNIVASVAPEYAMELQGQNFAESGGSIYDPNMVIENKITGGTSTGGYKFDPNAFSSDYGNANFEFSDLTPVPEPAPVEFTSLPNTGMTDIPGYTTPLPTTFEGPIPTGTTLPTGSTIVNTYDGGFESRPAHSTDNDKPAGPGDTGYEQAQLLGNLQSGGTGIIYKDDRREVYLDGVLIGNPKGAEDAREMLAKAKEKKAAASQPSPLPADTSTSTGMEVRALPNGTEYYVDAAGNFAGLK
jgi:hypothetical protein